MTTLSFLQETLASWMQTFALLLGATFWMKNGTILLNASNEPVQCASCPCSGESTPCCSSPGLPSTLHLTISGSGSVGVDGTYPLTWNSNQWTYSGSSGLTSAQLYCNVNTSPPSCGFSLVTFVGGLAWEVSTCGTTSGTWSSTNCTTSPYLTSNPTGSGGAPTPTFTVGS